MLKKQGQGPEQVPVFLIAISRCIKAVYIQNVQVSKNDSNHRD